MRTHKEFLDDLPEGQERPWIIFSGVGAIGESVSVQVLRPLPPEKAAKHWVPLSITDPRTGSMRRGIYIPCPGESICDNLLIGTTRLHDTSVTFYYGTWGWSFTHSKPAIFAFVESVWGSLKRRIYNRIAEIDPTKTNERLYDLRCWRLKVSRLSHNEYDADVLPAQALPQDAIDLVARYKDSLESYLTKPITIEQIQKLIASTGIVISQRQTFPQGVEAPTLGVGSSPVSPATPEAIIPPVPIMDTPPPVVPAHSQPDEALDALEKMFGGFSEC